MEQDDRQPIEFTLLVAPDDPDNNFRDDQARQLRDLIEDQIDDAEADLVRGGALPDGARAVAEAVTVGHIALAVLPVALTGLFGLLRDWRRGKDERNYRIKVGDVEVELPGDTSWEEAEARIKKLLQMQNKDEG